MKTYLIISKPMQVPLFVNIARRRDTSRKSDRRRRRMWKKENQRMNWTRTKTKAKVHLSSGQGSTALTVARRGIMQGTVIPKRRKKQMQWKLVTLAKRWVTATKLSAVRSQANETWKRLMPPMLLPCMRSIGPWSWQYLTAQRKRIPWMTRGSSWTH